MHWYETGVNFMLVSEKPISDVHPLTDMSMILANVDEKSQRGNCKQALYK
jgi:hypothetical protein